MRLFEIHFEPPEPVDVEPRSTSESQPRHAKLPVGVWGSLGLDLAPKSLTR